jgi:hypothetical protein
MTADDLVNAVRKGADKLRVDNIILDTGEQEFHGKGILRLSTEQIQLDMSFDAGQTPPTRRTGVFTKSEYWKLHAVVEDSLRFKCDYVYESNRTGLITTLTLQLHPIELIPSDWDALSPQESDRIHRQLPPRTEPAMPINVAGQKSANHQPNIGSVYYFAQIANYQVPALLCKATDVIEINPYLGERRSGALDTITGEIEGYDFAFINQRDPPDLHVHLKSKEGYHSSSSEQDWKTFYALMQALAFTLGVQAWPYRIQYSRDGQKIADRVTPPRRLPKTLFVPFHLATFNAADVISKATAFFRDESKLHKEVAHILFLFREAADYQNVHIDITVLALCVLFESLVNQIFNELKLRSKAPLAAPTELSMIRRLLRLCRRYDRRPMRQRFQAVVTHFDLPCEAEMDRIFDAWKHLRDPLVHGKGRANQPEAEWKSSMTTISEIAGVMNILVLKLLGYSGPMCASVIAEKYVQL